MFKDVPILYVDKNVDSCEMILLWLQMNSCIATAVTSGEDALRAFDQHRFDLCIVNYTLPDCTGIEVCQRVRQKWPTMPFILISADARPTIRTEAAIAGMHFLSMPVNLDLLHQIVESIVHCSSDQAA